jgi:hypothetical protein
MAEKILGVEPNASLSDIKRAYHMRIKELDPMNEKFQGQFDSYTTAYNKLVETISNNRTAGYRHTDVIIPFDSFYDPFGELTLPSLFSYRPYDMFSRLHDSVDRVMGLLSSKRHRKYDNDFKFREREYDRPYRDVDDDEEKPDLIENTDKPDSYCKYVSSVSSYDNGKRYSKTTTRVERVKDGKRTVSHVRKIQDGDKVIIERGEPTAAIEQKENGQKDIKQNGQ